MESSIAAERAASFVIERVRATRGRLWDEGARRAPLGWGEDEDSATPALSVLSRRRVRGIPEPVARGLVAWAGGGRPVDLLTRIPSAQEVLERQARGRRFVSLLDDATAARHGDPRHPDGLSFALHDLCHLEKFVAPDDYLGQVGFFTCVARALAHPAMVEVQRGFDEVWRADRDYVIADMNGSAVFLFAALKMKLNMAVRRRLARSRGVPAPTSGPLDPEERAARAPALDALLMALGLPESTWPAGRNVSARRDSPTEARALLDAFAGEGRRALGGAPVPR